METAQWQKYEAFKALHYRGHAVVVPNPWNAGTARILEALGFEALATTSAGYAFQVGKRDSAAALGRDEIMANAAEIAAAVELPVSGDLEDGFGASPDACAETVRAAVAAGLVGGAIEDASGDPRAPIYDFALAVERIAAAAEAAKGQPFLLTARAENFITGNPDLADTIARLQAFSAAGADVLYAPGLHDLAMIRRVCAEVDKPVNVVMGLQGAVFHVDELSAAGVARISTGGSLARAALGAFERAAREIAGQGTFSYAEAAMPGAEIKAYMAQGVVRDKQ